MIRQRVRGQNMRGQNMRGQNMRGQARASQGFQDRAHGQLRAVSYSSILPGLQNCPCLHVAIWLFALCRSVAADAPVVKFLTPAGGQRGATTQVTLHGEFSWPATVWCPDAQVTLREEKGRIDIAVGNDCPKSRVWLRLLNQDGVSARVPFVLGNLPELAEVEPNNSVATAQWAHSTAVAPEVILNGVLQESHDVDAFAFRLQQGQTIVAAIEANTPFGSPIDAILQIVGTDGVTLAENHDSWGLDPRLAFRAPRDGTYVARVFAFPANPNQSIRFHGGDDCVYRLTLTTGPFITHAMPMAVATGSVEPVQLLGWNMPDDFFLRPGDQLREHWKTGRAETVSMRGWSGSTSLIQVAAGVFSTSQANTESPQVISVPASVSGNLRLPRAADSFRCALQANQRVRIEVQAPSLGSGLVPRVVLRAADGSVAVGSPERGEIRDAVLTHTVKHDGDYQLEVTDRFGHGGEHHFYRMLVTLPPPKVRLTANTDRILVNTGEEAELVVQVQRESGNGDSIGDVEVSVVGLPDGVTCAPVVSKSEGDTSKQVTLKISAATTERFQGPVQIQGKVSEGPTFKATTPKRFGDVDEDIWLTVLPLTEE